MSRRYGSLGILEDYTLKRIEAEERLAVPFGAFVVSGSGSCFISSTNVAPVRIQQDNFMGLIIGDSHKETEELMQAYRWICTQIQSTFSEYDLHARMVVKLVSDYLKEVTEDMTIPRAIAAEMLIYDQDREVIYQCHFDGEFKENSLEHSSDKIFFVGGYLKQTRVKVERFLSNIPEVKQMIKNQAVAINFARKMKRLTRLPYVNIIAAKG